MPIDASEFVRRVTSVPCGVVAGEQVHGVVRMQGVDITQPDWKDCRFDASLILKECRFGDGLDLANAKLGGDLDIREIEFARGGLSARNMHVHGTLAVRGVKNSWADMTVGLRKESEPNSEQGYIGIDLSGSHVDGDLRVADCTGSATGGLASALCLEGARVGGMSQVGEGCRNLDGLFLSRARFLGGLSIHLDASGARSGEWKFLLWNQLECGGDLSVQLGRDVVLHRFFLQSANIAGDMKIFGSPVGDSVPKEDRAALTSLEAAGCQVQGKIELQGFRLPPAEDLKPGSARVTGSINLCRSHASGFSIRHVEVDLISMVDLRAAQDVAFSGIETASLDLYGACAKNVTLQDVHIRKAGSSDDIEVGLMDLGGSTIDALVCVEDCRFGNAKFRYSSMAALRLQDSDADSVELTGCRIQAYVRVLGCRIAEFTADNVRGGTARLEIFDEKYNGRQLKGDLDHFADDEPGKHICEVVGDAEAFAAALVDRRAVSSIGTIDLAGSHWFEVDLRHAYLARPATRKPGGAPETGSDVRGEEPLINGTNMTIDSALCLRVTQFPASTKMLVLDVSGARVERMDLGRPLPGRMRIAGARIGSWGLVSESAAEYKEILDRVTEFDREAYMDMESRLENAGMVAEADKLHVIRRIREGQNLEGTRKFRARMHGFLLDYGTRSAKILRFWAAAVFLCTLVLINDYEAGIQIDPQMQISIAECGSACDEMDVPSLKASWPGRVSDSLQLAVRDGVPIIDIGLAPHLRAKAESLSFWALVMVRLIGWIAWPLFLTSAVATFLPKRYRA